MTDVSKKNGDSVDVFLSIIAFVFMAWIVFWFSPWMTKESAKCKQHNGQMIALTCVKNDAVIELPKDGQ